MIADREYSLCFSFQPGNRIAESRAEIAGLVSQLPCCLQVGEVSVASDGAQCIAGVEGTCVSEHRDEAKKRFEEYPRISEEEAARKRAEQEAWLVETGWCTGEDIARYYRVRGKI